VGLERVDSSLSLAADCTPAASENNLVFFALVIGSKISEVIFEANCYC